MDVDALWCVEGRSALCVTLCRVRTAGVMVWGVELFVAIATVLGVCSVMTALLLVVAVVLSKSSDTTAARHSVVKSVTKATIRSDARRMCRAFITVLQRYRL